MKYLKLIFISTICYLISLSVYAQTSTIVVKAQASEGDKIKIRWVIVGDSASNNLNVNDNLTEVWSRYIKNGFIVERRRSGSSVIEKVFTIKPDESKLADGIINSPTQEEKDACKIMKKCIFGPKNALYSKPQNYSNEEEIFNRYFYATVASAMSFKASCYAGLALVDDSIEPSSGSASIVYEYTIKEAIPPFQSSAFSTVVTIENTVLLLKTNANLLRERQSRVASGQRMAAMLEEPPVPIAKFRNKKVELKWRWKKPNAEISHQGIYYGYYVEKASEPNLTSFKRINKVPLVGGSINSDTLFYIDQDTTKTNLILQNGKKYVYRLVGKTYFDDEIISTQSVTGKCVDDSPYFPYISKDSLSRTKEVELSWELPKNAPMYHFKRYAIGRSEGISKDSVFKKIKIIGGIGNGEKYVDSSRRTAKVVHSTNIKNTTQAAYYVVFGITETDETTFMSDPVLVQGVDSLPPKIPANVQAVWSATSKTATITWIPNSENIEESDLLGYKIYRSLPGGLPIAISDTAINKKRTYIDTVKIANLKVFYFVSSIDKMFNPSKLSAPGILRIPDNDPPVKPSFGNFKINNQGQVELNIYASPSTDVASHELRRNINTQISNLNTWTTPEKPSSYTDKGLNAGGRVSYIIEATDSTGNKSSDTLEVDIPSILIAKPQFTLLNSSASRIDPSIKLNWDYSVLSAANEVREFVLLKSNVSYDTTGKLGTWKTVSGDTREISDFDVRYELTYKYGVKAIFKDGSSSAWLYTTLTMPTVCGAAKYLEERGRIEPSSSILKEACSSIRLLPGFHAKRNSVFHAVIKQK